MDAFASREGRLGRTRRAFGLLLLALATAALGAGACSTDHTAVVVAPGGADASTADVAAAPTATSPPAPRPDGGPAAAGTIASCAVTDTDTALKTSALQQFGAWTNGQGGTSVILSLDDNKGARRYLLTSANPCTLERDSSFGSGGFLNVSSTDLYRIDGIGELWRAADSYGGLDTKYPAPGYECSVPSTLQSELAVDFAVSSDGKTGWAIYSDGTAGLMQGDAGTSCAMAPVTPSEALPFIGTNRAFEATAIAVDAAGRLHVVEKDKTGASSDHVFGKDGTLVATIAKDGAGTPLADVRAATPCGAGVCLLQLASSAGLGNQQGEDSEQVVVIDANLAPTNVITAKLASAPNVSGASIAAQTTGPIIFALTVDDPGSFTNRQIVFQIAAAP